MIEARQKLKAELDSDPLVRGYAEMASTIEPSPDPVLNRIRDDQVIADDMNSEYLTRPVTRLSSQQVKSTVDKAEYASLTDAAKSQFLQLVSRDDLDPSGLDAEILKGIFTSAAGPKTRQALAGLVNEPISRATQLGIPLVRTGHIQEARALP